MKLTKHAQSCFLIETNGKRILIDPGKYVFDKKVEGLDPGQFKDIDILLLTHRHHDHCFPEALKVIQKNNLKMKIYCNKEVEEILKKEGIKCNVVKVGNTMKEGGVKIDVVKALHGYKSDMLDINFPKENNGYLIESENKRIYHTSDTIGFYTDLKTDILLIPICGNGVVFEPKEAVEWCEMIKPGLVIPMHYDGLRHLTGTERFEGYIKKTDLKYKIIRNGETIEV
ncbi:MAG: MBL fold metallo-hydrolase [Candidatus Woesearchaeota archaeon]|nr:MBL fold metallo-hydrolase [Candidatus Woesearchaeota archaeon]